jgi:hypothetical protein
VDAPHPLAGEAKLGRQSHGLAVAVAEERGVGQRGLRPLGRNRVRPVRF